MAINRISAPLATSPATFATPVVNQLASNILDLERAERISGSNVLEGARFNVGGVEYVADADTAITGTASKYVQITASGATASAAFVADLTGVTWNAEYKGYYDISGNLYVFDEMMAMADGAITAMKKEYLGAKNIATGWHRELSQSVSADAPQDVLTFGDVHPTLLFYNRTGTLSRPNQYYAGGSWVTLFNLTFHSNGVPFHVSKINISYTNPDPEGGSQVRLYIAATATELWLSGESSSTITASVDCDFDVGLSNEATVVAFQRKEYGSGSYRGPLSLSWSGSITNGGDPGLLHLICNSGNVLTVALG